MNSGELYEMAGLNWRMPIYVTWINSANAEVTIANIPLLKQQRQAIETDLSAAATHREQNKWFIPRAALSQIAVKSERADPEDVVVWKHEDDFGAVRTDFVNAYCSKPYVPTPLRNPAIFAPIWSSIQMFMLDWLLHHEAEIDLGFAKLNALCARANWKNVVIGRMVARRRNNVRSDTEQTRRETRRLLHQSFVTAYDAESRTAQWTLEITPQKRFRDMAETKEIDRKRGRGTYGHKILQLLKSHDHKNRMHGILADYWRRTQTPCAALPHGFSPKDDVEPAECETDMLPAPNWAPTPVVDGAAMSERNGFVAVDSAVAPSDLRRLVPAG